MRRLLIPILSTALSCASAASAQESGVFREADESLTCAQIGDEAAQLSEVMGDATPQGGWLSSLGNLAKSGASLLVPGAGLAVAGADAVRQPARDRDEAERSAIQNRWYYLNGLHAGRGCREPAATVAPASVQPQSPGRTPAIQPTVLPTPVRGNH
ncbi:hypothetical protein [Brevundimonas sp.]|uniref:hypothetical protein n=1 Tax=Brevundimonas sp. TaxID=1871086 RepID=UPI003D137FC6